MIKTITFTELCDLVANIDYLWADSYPVKFKTNNQDGEYEAGIGYLDVSNTTDDVEGIFAGYTDELQYLSHWGYDENDELVERFLDVQDPDAMAYEEIVAMLKKQCHINEDSEIYLYVVDEDEDDEFADDASFTGTQECIVWNDCIEEVKYKELNNPCRNCTCVEFEACDKCKKMKAYLKNIEEKFNK